MWVSFGREGEFSVTDNEGLLLDEFALFRVEGGARTGDLSCRAAIRERAAATASVEGCAREGSPAMVPVTKTSNS